MSSTDLIQGMIDQAVESAFRKVLGGNTNSGSSRRLRSVGEAAEYLSLSKREVYNLIANRQLAAVKHGRRRMVDISDLDEFILRNKS